MEFSSTSLDFKFHYKMTTKKLLIKQYWPEWIWSPLTYNPRGGGVNSVKDCGGAPPSYISACCKSLNKLRFKYVKVLRSSIWLLQTFVLIKEIWKTFEQGGGGRGSTSDRLGWRRKIALSFWCYSTCRWEMLSTGAISTLANLSANEEASTEAVSAEAVSRPALNDGWIVE